MEFRGILTNQALTLDGKMLLTFEASKNDYSELIGKDLKIKATKWANKRSLDANAYCWVLISKVAQYYKVSKEEIYESLLQDHPILYEDEEGKHISIALKDTVDISSLTTDHMHWWCYGQRQGSNIYFLLKGTSQYDSKEMSWFIDEVVSLAKSVGIETMTPNELEQLESRWSQSRA